MTERTYKIEEVMDEMMQVARLIDCYIAAEEGTPEFAAAEQALDDFMCGKPSQSFETPEEK